MPEESPFDCECKKWMRTACAGESFYKEHEGKRYCVLHYPGKEKSEEFATALKNKRDANDFDFSGVWFPDAVDFRKFEFSTDALFNSATFSAKADFNDATFSAKADFGCTKFNAIAGSSQTADFSDAKFKVAAYFSRAEFEVAADFTAASFSGAAYFRFTTFSTRANFRHAIFKDLIYFSGENSFSCEAGFDLQLAQIDKPERVYFYEATLRPHWFVYVDPRKFVFTDVNWRWKDIRIEGEIQSLVKIRVSSPRRLLAIACRQLAENAENNNRYEEASHFRYWAMDLARQQKWAGRAFWKTDWLHILYWAVSGYGERIWLATLWLLAVWIVFALLYMPPRIRDDFDKTSPMKNPFTYSFGVMSLQKPEPKPLTGTAQTLVLLETILGPLQAALLALAIRRKFMR